MLQIVQQLILGILSQFLLIYLVYVHPLLQYFRKYANCLQKFRNSVKPVLLNPGKMKKIPAHLAVSIGHCTEFECFDNNGNTNTSKYLDRLADIAYWASLLNIEYLSFYEPEGLLKSQPQLLCHYLTNKFQRCDLENESQITCTNGDKNMTVFIRCRGDGKKLIGLVIQEIILSKQLKSMPSTPITEQMFDYHLNQILYPGLCTNMDKTLHTKFNPDLITICGSNSSLMGFLPWHIPNTEIHMLPNLLDLCSVDFEKSIQNFANCEQRFGK